MTKRTEHILIFLLIIQLIKTENITSDIYEFSEQESLTTCLVNILHKTYKKSLDSGTVATLFGNQSSAYFLLQKIYQEYKWAIINLSSKTDSEILITSTEINTYLIQIRGLEEIKVDLLRLRNKDWNPKSKLIIYAEQNFHTDKYINHDIFKTLWKQKALNSIVLLPQEENNTIFNIYTWFPYKNGNCGTYDEASLLNVCQNGNFNTNNELFPAKVPMNLRGE